MIQHWYLVTNVHFKPLVFKGKMDDNTDMRTYIKHKSGQKLVRCEMNTKEEDGQEAESGTGLGTEQKRSLTCGKDQVSNCYCHS